MYRLAINQNPLESIQDEAFYGLDNTLWELELREDKLTVVPSRALRYLQKLHLLDLTGDYFYTIVIIILIVRGRCAQCHSEFKFNG